MAFSSNVRLWATTVSTHAGTGRKIIFRYAKEFSGEFNKHSQPVRIIIAWKYLSENGQPTAGDHHRMNQLEDLVESAVNEAGFATLALVSTGEGLREWIYYVASEDQFMARLNNALADTPAFPIEIHTGHDPCWNAYQEFAAGVRGANPP